MNPCSPEEIGRVARLMAEGHMGSLDVKPIRETFEVTGSDDVGATMSELQAATFLPRFRITRAAWGDDFGVRVVDKVMVESTKTNNNIAGYVGRLNEAQSPLYSSAGGMFSKFTEPFKTIPEAMDRELSKALMAIDDSGKWLVPPSSFSKPVQEATPAINKILVEASKEYGVDHRKFMTEWMGKTRERGSGIFFHAGTKRTPEEEAFKNSLSPNELEMFATLEKTGQNLPEGRASVAINSFIHAGARNSILNPAMKQLEKEHVNDFFGVKFVREAGSGQTSVSIKDKVGYQMWREYKSAMMGAPTARDVQLAASGNRFLAKVNASSLGQKYGWDYQTDTRGVLAMANMFGNFFHMGVLGGPIGGRPGSIIRQLGQAVPSLAEFGTKRMMSATFDTMNDFANLAARYNQMGILSSHIDQLVSSLETARGVGKSVSAATEYSMKLFGAVDKFMRVDTARAAEKRFDDFLAAGKIDKVPGTVEIKKEVSRLMGNGKVDEAKTAYLMHNVNLLQYGYGKANRPDALRSSLMSFSSLLMSYPLNTFEMVRIMTKRAGQGIVNRELEDVMPLARLIGVSYMLGMAGSEYLNADFRSMMFFSAFPHALAFPKAVADIYNAGVNTIEYGTGTLFNVGETNYHKAQRWESYGEVKRDLKGFVPWGGFYDDVSKMIDEGSLMRAFAMTPKADVLNAYAKRKRAEAAAERPHTSSDWGRGGL